MALIKSISGIRGTIGGRPGEGLSPIDIVKFTYAYCATLPSRKSTPNGDRYKVVVGKDARLSGAMVEQLVVGTLFPAESTWSAQALPPPRQRKWL